MLACRPCCYPLTGAGEGTGATPRGPPCAPIATHLCNTRAFCHDTQGMSIGMDVGWIPPILWNTTVLFSVCSLSCPVYVFSIVYLSKVKLEWYFHTILYKWTQFSEEGQATYIKIEFIDIIMNWLYFTTVYVHTGCIKCRLGI